MGNYVAKLTTVGNYLISFMTGFPATTLSLNRLFMSVLLAGGIFVWWFGRVSRALFLLIPFRTIMCFA